MVSKEELYVSVSQEKYRLNKSDILMSQADFLCILKRLNNLRVLDRQKQDLKNKLYKLFVSILSDISLIQNRIPAPKIPKGIQKPKKIEAKAKVDFSRRDSIEEELKLIREKLRKLNS